MLPPDMTGPDSTSKPAAPRRVRWWPAVLLVVLAIIGVVWTRSQADWAFQRRNQTTATIAIIGGLLLVVWWAFFSRAPKRWRLGVLFGVAGMIAICAALFRVRGMSGDLAPILEFRWSGRSEPAAQPANPTASPTPAAARAGADDFPQFLGPERNGVLPGPRLATNWVSHPPAILWRQKAGPAWSGFAIAGNLALTQEQRGAEECVAAYEMATGRQLWLHTDPARYETTIAGEGPRATPTVSGERVFTFGATGLLNCLALADGKARWTRDLAAESGGKIPRWGFASSPLLVDGLVIVHGGEGAARSLFAFHAADGKPAWSAGATDASYASPVLAPLADGRQVLSFNDGSVSGHDPATGAQFWERPWGNGNVVCSSPVVVGTNRVLFSSGYGVGAELLEIAPDAAGKFSARLVWKSIRMKAKFAHLFARGEFLYGLDDGILACVSLADGSLRWKEGRYGHGQGLLVGEFYLLMAESGELTLLRPTPDDPNELARFPVFGSKTWNPIALSGDLLLARNDREAACLRLKLAD